MAYLHSWLQPVTASSRNLILDLSAARMFLIKRKKKEKKEEKKRRA